jgi:hypothetical protein
MPWEKTILGFIVLSFRECLLALAGACGDRSDCGSQAEADDADQNIATGLA